MPRETLKPRVNSIIPQSETWIPLKPRVPSLVPQAVNQGSLAPTAVSPAEQTQDPLTQ
jgi:hypothetical protein